MYSNTKCRLKYLYGSIFMFDKHSEWNKIYKYATKYKKPRHSSERRFAFWKKPITTKLTSTSDVRNGYSYRSGG